MSSSAHSVKQRRKTLPFIIQLIIFLALLLLLFRIMYLHANITPAIVDGALSLPVETPVSEQSSAAPAESSAPAETSAPAQEPLPDFAPYHTEETDPANFIKTVGIEVNGTVLGEDETYTAEYPIDFGYGSDYTDVSGIITFRGDNFRSGASYGYASMTDFSLSGAWSVTTGTLTHDGAVWTGSGWVGQPLIVKWPAETKAVMNMYDWAKADDELVEVIYATMDGNVYFLDLETGKNTRDTLKLGYTFKGSGALDPRGYPILYLGAGYDSDRGTSRAFVISLIDSSILYEFGNNDPFSLRGTLSYFDSSALVDAETDQLIYPGENGILYIIKLNTQYNEQTGELSIAPSPVVKWHYYGTRTSLSSHWVGMESSAVIWRGHIIMTDNGGNLMCLDLNTLELDWVQDTLDDTNCSPVLSIENGHPYIYVSTSFHYGWRSWTTATVPIWKIDAENGEIVWQVDYTCYTESGVSGGVQSTAAIGRDGLAGRIYVTIAKTDTSNNGILACIDTESGDILWEKKSYYTWSSPVLVYNEDGSGYVAYCTYGSSLYLLDGLTGETLSSFDLKGGVEASPAVYNDMLVVGTRKCLIWGVKLG